MNCPSYTEIRKLRAKGTALARRAADQAESIRDAAFKTAYRFIKVVDARGEHVDNYPVSREFYDFMVRERAAKTLGLRSQTLTTEQAYSLLRENARKEQARMNESIEQQLARQSEEIHGTLAAVEIKRNLWS
jgi:hypothetical protein